ncbi:MAG: DUF1648 domain-containing protein [Chitinophagaceae bacterium]|nr:DUF1648 domain-containing protein [Chitinophagaceae bacterium]
MNGQRPQIKIEKNGTDKVLEYTGWAFLILCWIYVFMTFGQLPEAIPTHFGISGEPDGYGSRNMIFLLPAIATVLFIGLTVLTRFPHKFNYLSRITEQNAITRYTFAVRLIRFLKWAIVVLFTFITYQTIETAKGRSTGMGEWFVPLVVMGFGVFFLLILIFGRSITPTE